MIRSEVVTTSVQFTIFKCIAIKCIIVDLYLSYKFSGALQSLMTFGGIEDVQYIHELMFLIFMTCVCVCRRRDSEE